MDVVTVIQKGPQGVAGPAGAAGVARILSSIANTSQAVPQHDGLVGTEIPLELGTSADEFISISGSEVTLLQDLPKASVNLSINTTTTGGGNKVAKLTIWSESSTDGGVTWGLRPDSLRNISVADESSGSHSYIYSSMVSTPAGAMFRIVATNTGVAGANLTISSIPALTTSRGDVDGQSAHVTFIY